MTKTIQIRKRGVLTLPKVLREKYRLDEGDPVTLIDLGEGILISPKLTIVPKLVAELEYMMEKEGLSLEDLLQGVAEERSRYGKK
ncbi:MAG: AbrB/MazE/SpoVT family DNA-binding domain-containing protein [Fidelibacterota bacterium]